MILMGVPGKKKWKIVSLQECESCSFATAVGVEFLCGIAPGCAAADLLSLTKLHQWTYSRV